MSQEDPRADQRSEDAKAEADRQPHPVLAKLARLLARHAARERALQANQDLPVTMDDQ